MEVKMLNVIDKKIYTDDGSFLKKIECPKNISASDLNSQPDNKLFCNQCEKSIIDAQAISEDNLVKALKEDKNTCVKISRLNPMFRFVQ